MRSIRSSPPVRSRHGRPSRTLQNQIVGRAAAAATAVFAADYDTVYDGVLGPWQLDDFMRSGSIDALDYAIVLPPVDICVERVAARLGHGFSDEAAARHMHAEFATATIDHRHVLAEVVDTPAAMVELIVERRAAARCAGRPEVVDGLGRGR